LINLCSNNLYFTKALRKLPANIGQRIGSLPSADRRTCWGYKDFRCQERRRLPVFW